MAALSAQTKVTNSLGDVKPKMLRMDGESDPKPLGIDLEQAYLLARSEIGQALDWSLDQHRTEKKAAASEMRFSNQATISEWVSGRERVQLDKLKVHLPEVYVELLLTLLQACDGVEVRTQVTMRRVV